MPASSRFAIAVHILTLMAQSVDEPCTSAFVACSVNTNPVVIRRIICALRRARMVSSQTGVAGGSRLAREPERITLLEVYRAVEEGKLLSLHRQKPNPQCPVGINIEGVLDSILRDAEYAFEQVLAQITIDAVLRAVRPTRAQRKRTKERDDRADFTSVEQHVRQRRRAHSRRRIHD